MKKYNVFKILSITILLTIVLSFIIPQTSFDGYGNLTKGNINPVSIIDTFANGLTSLGVFLNVFIYILCIGVFYFILKKTNKYDELVNNTACIFKNNKVIFSIISIVIFVVVTAIIGDIMPMLVLVPVFIDIARKLGYDKKTSILMTLGSIILGSAGSLYTFYTNQILTSTVTDNILFKVFILFIIIASLVIFILLFANKPENTKLEKIKSKNSTFISVLFDILLVLIILGVTPWNSYFGFEGFNNLHETITGFQLFGVSIFNSIIGSSISALGAWTLFDISTLLLVLSLVAALVYRLKFDELLESVAEGLKKTLPYALIIVFSNIVLVNVYNSGFFYTIITSVAKMNDKLLSGSLISMLSSFVYPDYSYASQFTLSTLATVISDTQFNIVLALVFQVIYSLFLLVMPTSILILLGLRYVCISYKEWIKYIWKYLVVLLTLMFSVLFVASIKFISVPSIVVLILLSILGYALLISSILYKFIIKNKKDTNEKRTVTEKSTIEPLKEEKENSNKKQVTPKKTNAKGSSKKKNSKNTK